MSETPEHRSTRQEGRDDAAEARGPAVEPEVVEKEKKRVGKPDARFQIQEFFAGVARSTGPSYHPIFEKFEREHVTQFLEQTHQTDRDERQLRRGNQWFRLVYVAIAVLVFVFLTLLLLPDHAALYLEILKVLGIFGAGAAGGYGLRAYQDRLTSPSTDS